MSISFEEVINLEFWYQATKAIFSLKVLLLSLNTNFPAVILFSTLYKTQVSGDSITCVSCKWHGVSECQLIKKCIWIHSIDILKKTTTVILQWFWTVRRICRIKGKMLNDQCRMSSYRGTRCGSWWFCAQRSIFKINILLDAQRPSTFLDLLIMLSFFLLLIVIFLGSTEIIH